MDVSVVIVSWNTHDLLAQCLASIYAHPAAGDFEIIVVDNASADGSVAMVHEYFPQVTLLANTSNTGFAAANNQGIHRSTGRYVLLLNPDTVVQHGAIDALVNFMDCHSEAGAAGSMLLNPDDSLQPSCSPAPTLGRELWRLAHLDRIYPLALYRMAEWPTDQPRQVETLQGASLIVRRAVIECVGDLDDRYFMYSEEVDWCERIREAGWFIYWVPQSRVIHYGGQSTRQIATPMFLQLYRAKLQYFRKHYGSHNGLLYKAVLFVAAVARILLMPLVWLARPAQRREQVELASRYGRLILALPGM